MTGVALEQQRIELIPIQDLNNCITTQDVASEFHQRPVPRITDDGGYIYYFTFL
jgi:hypothetical protein